MPDADRGVQGNPGVLPVANMPAERGSMIVGLALLGLGLLMFAPPVGQLVGFVLVLLVGLFAVALAVDGSR